MNLRRASLLSALGCGLSLTACEPQSTSTSPESATASAREAAPDPTPPASAADNALDTALGGQLFDKWFGIRGYQGGFVPDAINTDELDGSRGPNDNGTLNDREGKPLANTGHDYRLKNLFGWDLRGAEGIYGAEYQNKPYVLQTNLLTDTRSKAQLIAWFTQGDATLPAFGEVLSPEQIEALVAFILKVRDGELPRPEQIFELSKDAPKNYTLVAGADTEAGARFFDQRCSGCHGARGDELAIDDKYSVGAFGRMNAYEGWLKVVNGHPGSPMSRQSTDAREVLNLFAALCDREAFAALDAEHEVSDGDPRCAAYLK